MNYEQIAKICHQANKAYCESINDFSQKNWEDAPEWQKVSCMEGIKFLIDTEDSDHSQLHKNWMDEKIAEGWKYGPVKNEELKEHPCLVSWGELSETQRKKDELFYKIVSVFKDNVD